MRRAGVLLICGLVCVTLMRVASRAGAQSARPESEAKVSEQNTEKIGLVDFGADKDAPKAPDIGIAISLGEGRPPKTFALNQPIILHGAYSADMKMIRACKEGLAPSILLTLIRTDRPWGQTARLVNPSAAVQAPESPADANYGDNFREGGQFNVDLTRFFSIPKEPGQYQVEAVLTSYHSSRLDFEVK
jgi:hypothetical protein